MTLSESPFGQPLPQSSGLPLASAAMSWASEDAKDRIKLALRKTEVVDLKGWSSQPLSQQVIETMQRMTTELIKTRELNDAVSAARTQLTERLLSGSLIATGIRTRPAIELSPSLIPRYIFDKPKVDWKADVVENAGTRFELVRIFYPSAADAPSSVLIGRPSKREIIDGVLVKMLHEGRPIAVHQQRVCEDVRIRAKSQGHDVSAGFSDPVIKSRIRLLARRERS